MEQFFFSDPSRVVDQSKSIGGHWEWDSSEITALSRTHLTPLIETLVRKALKPARIGLQWLPPRTTRTSLPLGEKCICREKGAAIFSGRGLCTKCYSFPAVVSTQPLSLEGRKRRWRIHRVAEKPQWDVSTTFP